VASACDTSSHNSLSLPTTHPASSDNENTLMLSETLTSLESEVHRLTDMLIESHMKEEILSKALLDQSKLLESSDDKKGNSRDHSDSASRELASAQANNAALTAQLHEIGSVHQQRCDALAASLSAAEQAHESVQRQLEQALREGAEMKALLQGSAESEAAARDLLIVLQAQLTASDAAARAELDFVRRGHAQECDALRELLRGERERSAKAAVDHDSHAAASQLRCEELEESLQAARDHSDSASRELASAQANNAALTAQLHEIGSVHQQRCDALAASLSAAEQAHESVQRQLEQALREGAEMKALLQGSAESEAAARDLLIVLQAQLTASDAAARAELDFVRRGHAQECDALRELLRGERERSAKAAVDHDSHAAASQLRCEELEESLQAARDHSDSASRELASAQANNAALTAQLHEIGSVHQQRCDALAASLSAAEQAHESVQRQLEQALREGAEMKALLQGSAESEAAARDLLIVLQAQLTASDAAARAELDFVRRGHAQECDALRELLRGERERSAKAAVDHDSHAAASQLRCEELEESLQAARDHSDSASRELASAQANNAALTAQLHEIGSVHQQRCDALAASLSAAEQAHESVQRQLEQALREGAEMKALLQGSAESEAAARDLLIVLQAQLTASDAAARAELDFVRRGHAQECDALRELLRGERERSAKAAVDHDSHAAASQLRCEELEESLQAARDHSDSASRELASAQANNAALTAQLHEIGSVHQQRCDALAASLSAAEQAHESVQRQLEQALREGAEMKALLQGSAESEAAARDLLIVLQAQLTASDAAARAELDFVRRGHAQECDALRELLRGERERSAKAAVDHDSHAAASQLRCEELEESLQAARDHSDSASRELASAQANNAALTAQLHEIGSVHQQRCDALAASLSAAEQAHESVQRQLEQALREGAEMKALLQGSAESEAAARDLLIVLQAQLTASDAAARAELDFVRRGHAQECDALRELLRGERERSAKAAVDHDSHAAASQLRCEELEESLQAARDHSDSASRELASAQANNAALTAQLHEIGSVHQQRCDALAASLSAAEQAHESVQRQLEQALREGAEMKALLQGSAESEAAARDLLIVLQAQLTASDAAARAELDFVRRGHAQECDALRELLRGERERSAKAAVDHDSHAAASQLRCEELEESLQAARDHSDSASRELASAQANNAALTAQLHEIGSVHQQRCDALAASLSAAEQAHESVQRQLELLRNRSPYLFSVDAFVGFEQSGKSIHVVNAFLVDSDSQTEVLVDQFDIELQRHRMQVFCFIII
jgi:chromosome segregation ATPase